MVQWHEKSDKKPSGGKRHTIDRCDKKKAWMGGRAAETKTDSTVTKETRETKSGRGSSSKVRLTATKFANITDPKTKKAVKCEITAVKTNDANRLFARSNISTKGAIIKVQSEGKEKLARVTNRPGQDGVVNAILIE